jgi:hypothetical protein
MMQVYSITAEWEDEREGQWVQTYAVLAESKSDAAVFVRAFVAESQVVDGPSVQITGGKVMTAFAQAPRIVAKLVVPKDQPKWVDVRSESGS